MLGPVSRGQDEVAHGVDLLVDVRVVEGGIDEEVSENIDQFVRTSRMETVVVHNIKRANGMKKRTWEIMEDDGLHTYNPIANIVYQEAIKQMNDLKGKGAENAR